MPDLPIRFRHHVLDPAPPGDQHDIALLADLTGNGLPDIIIGGKQGGLFWYENPGWDRHFLGKADNLEAGGVVCDVNRDGRLDLIVGQGPGNSELYWFECPPDPRDPWTRHLIDDRFEQYHDQAVGDVDGDGEVELVILSQRDGILGYYDLPADPAAGPWQAEFRCLAQDMHDEEGLVVAPLEPGGRPCLVAGPNVFRPCHCHSAEFHREPVAPGLKMTRCAVGDLNGDGWADLVFCEGEADAGMLLWFAAPRWRPYPLAEGLDHPHSLQLADFTGSGRLDIMVAEMGLTGRHSPRVVVYANEGESRFTPQVISEGVATHEAKVADLTGNGKPDIIGKAYQERHVDIWFNES